jgi:hypothetical protein
MAPFSEVKEQHFRVCARPQPLDTVAEELLHPLICAPKRDLAGDVIGASDSTTGRAEAAAVDGARGTPRCRACFPEDEMERNLDHYDAPRSRGATFPMAAAAC